MKREPPSWAFEPLTPADFERALEAHRAGQAMLVLPAVVALRALAERQRWALSWWNFEAAFLARMFESAENFALVVAHGGVTVRVPKLAHVLCAADLAALDRLYEDRSGWRTLVESRREIRRAVECGVVVSVDGTATLNSWQTFYAWAHGRYHALEDGADSWIGDDAS